MKLRVLFAWGLVAALMTQLGCDAPLEEDGGGPGGPTGPVASRIVGTVVNNIGSVPIGGVSVYDLNNVGVSDITAVDGSYELNYTLEDPYATSVVAIVNDFDPDTIAVTVNPGQDAVANFRLDESLFQIPLPPSVRYPAQIAFISASTSDIFVSGVGALENSILTYEVRDSLGAAIDASRRAYATYNLNFFPDLFATGGTPPTLIPSADSTDDVGRLRVNVSSGTQAGVVQIEVTINAPGGTIRSQPVRVNVSSGFPDQAHFNLTTVNRNFPGLDKYFVRTNITVQVADKFGNPVQNPTAVAFFTRNGSITSNNSVTGADGFLTQELISGNPFPEAASAFTAFGNGYSYVVAQTLGEGGAQVIDSLLMLWTGEPIIVKTGGPATFALANGGSDGPFSFTVMDRFGHPMSAGTQINASGTGLIVDGDANITMLDTFTSGPGTTDFTVSISDADPADTDPPAVTILTVTVVHPIYGTVKLNLASGSVD
ncbi:MAG: Ig-like domain-containing protein [Ignavibacteriae bacterium]|nr:Ig-like domain-containing protein [Ignavibacteriota bacterium]